jgi:hypothetical protein
MELVGEASTKGASPFSIFLFFLMAEQTVVLKIRGAVRCGDDAVNGSKLRQGDTVVLEPTDELNGLPDEIRGIAQTVVEASEPGGFFTYLTLTFDDTQLNGVLTTLKECHVKRVGCLTCCQLLLERIVALEDRLTAANIP